MKYKYTVINKAAIFSRPLTSSADTKEGIGAATGMTIPQLDWEILERSGKRIVEDENFRLLLCEWKRD